MIVGTERDNAARGDARRRCDQRHPCPVEAGETQVQRFELDLNHVADWYAGQRRRDLGF